LSMLRVIGGKKKPSTMRIGKARVSCSCLQQGKMCEVRDIVEWGCVLFFCFEWGKRKGYPNELPVSFLPWVGLTPNTMQTWSHSLKKK
jgi:hypothetical protein